MKKMRILWLFGLCTFSSAVFALPVENENLLSQTYLSCDDNAQGIIEKAYCLTEEETLQDAQLNRIYKKLQSQLNAAQKAKLIASQRIWLQSRDSDNVLESVLYGNSQPDNLQLGLNDIQRIALRTQQLQRYLDLMP